MTRPFPGDPYKGFTPGQVTQLVRDYRNPTLTVDDVCRKHRIGSERLMAILRHQGVKPRGLCKAPKGWRASRAPKVTVPPDTLARAKDTLRRRGCIVYDAEISEGPAGRGLIRVDNKRLTPAELIAAAAGVRV